MIKRAISCPKCGTEVAVYLSPVPTVDILIVDKKSLVLIKRKNPPYGWALPGGFVDYGESLEQAAVREALEETGLLVELIRQLGCYSDPKRDSRKHTITTVFLARAISGELKGSDDALEAHFFRFDELPEPIVFDHHQIIADYQAMA